MHPWTNGILPWIGGIFRGEYSYNDQDDYRLFLIVPYENQTAIFGIIDKMIAPMTVTQLYNNPENCETVCSDRFAYIHDGEFILIDKA